MFVKLVFDDTAVANSANHTAFMSDLNQILTGGIVDPANLTSPLFNKPNCTITGSLNTALYSMVSTLDHQMKLRKYHHSKTTGYDPSSIIDLYWSAGGRPSVRTSRSDGGGYFPNGSAQNSDWFYSNHPAGVSPNTYPHYYDKMMIAASDYWFIIQLVYGATTVMTYMMADYEATQTDVYAFQNLNALASPQVSFGDHVVNMKQDDDSTTDYPIIGRNTYVTKQGIVYGSTSSISPDNSIGFNPPSTNNAYQFFPSMNTTIATQPLQGGDGHLMQPVYVHSTGDLRDVSNVPGGMGKIPYLYRTTDNLSQPGDIITMGLDNYVSLPFHKTSGDSIGDVGALDVAHYLVPVTIGGI